MPRICYVDKNFHAKTLVVIEQAQGIVEEYRQDGLRLTLRQLYYQFVARDLLGNNMRAYNRLKGIVSDARLAGLLDWDSIEDRTRALVSRARWDSPQEIVLATSRQYHMDMWETQPRRVEVWIEKEALSGVFERVCRRLDVPFFACRGYTSQSEMWRAGQRLRAHKEEKGQPSVVVHFGDHDPSGMDMTRDVEDRLSLFGADVEVRRVALNMDQVEEYDPPPNPAKESDSRAADYVAEFGRFSWELDALEPRTLERLVEDEVDQVRDMDAWEDRLQEIQEGREDLRLVGKNWTTALAAASDANR